MSSSLADWKDRTALNRLPLNPAPAERPEADQDDPEHLAEVIAFPGRHNRPAKQTRRPLGGSEAGMATAEYAIATLAAVAFAGLLVLILRSGEVRGMLTGLVELALTAV